MVSRRKGSESYRHEAMSPRKASCDASVRALESKRHSRKKALRRRYSADAIDTTPMRDAIAESLLPKPIWPDALQNHQNPQPPVSLPLPGSPRTSLRRTNSLGRINSLVRTNSLVRSNSMCMGFDINADFRELPENEQNEFVTKLWKECERLKLKLEGQTCQMDRLQKQLSEVLNTPKGHTNKFAAEAGRQLLAQLHTEGGHFFVLHASDNTYIRTGAPERARRMLDKWCDILDKHLHKVHFKAMFTSWADTARSLRSEYRNSAMKWAQLEVIADCLNRAALEYSFEAWIQRIRAKRRLKSNPYLEARPVTVTITCALPSPVPALMFLLRGSLC